MSYTELYKFNKEGNAEMLGEVHNAWRGAMAIWRIIEEKYLTPCPKPAWMSDEDYNERGYSRTSQPPIGKESPLKPIWDLWKDKKVDRIDKIVLGSTFDNVIVMREDIGEVINAFEIFNGETSLKEQSKILKDSLYNEDLIAVAWNQTSVCADTWGNYSYDDDSGESIPYNILRQDAHWNLFTDLN